MPVREYPELPKELEMYVDKPYGGLFGDNTQIRIIIEIVADPYRYYRPKDFEELIGASAPSIRAALKNLTDLGFLIKDETDMQHPIYQPNLDSKKLLVLTLLSYALIDDRDGTQCLDDAILDHCDKRLKDRTQTLASATYKSYDIESKVDTGTYSVKIAQTNSYFKYSEGKA